MAKKLACRLGRHEWTSRVEGGESYEVYAAGEKKPPDSRRSEPSRGPSSVKEPKNLGIGWVAISRDGAGGDIGTGGGILAVSVVASWRRLASSRLKGGLS